MKSMNQVDYVNGMSMNVIGFLKVAQVRYEKNRPTFHYTGWFIGILILAYQNPHIIG